MSQKIRQEGGGKELSHMHAFVGEQGSLLGVRAEQGLVSTLGRGKERGKKNAEYIPERIREGQV